MTIADPKTYAVTKKQAVADDDDDLRDQIAALQATVQSLVAAKAGDGGLSEAKLETILLRVAQVSAEAQERAANPSNKTHPAISDYSYPEGDRARPRPKLKCPMRWIGYDVEPDTTRADELELLNLAEPGDYQFYRTDRTTREKLTITGERDASGTLSKLSFTFPVEENRATLPSMAAMLRDAFQIKSPEQVELERLRAEVTALRDRVAQ